MEYTSHYLSPLGGILLSGDEIGLTGLWFEGQKYFALHLDTDHEERDLPLFQDARRWLDIYFSGKEPDFKMPLHLNTRSRVKEVWEILMSIPYGNTMTYGDIAGQLAEKKGRSHMSAQGRRQRSRPQQNLCDHPMPPCSRHERQPDRICRGIDKKISLLSLEKADMSHLFIPASKAAPSHG